MNGTDTVLVSSEDLTSLKQAYLDTVTKIRNKFAKGASNARIMAIVAEYECEVLATHLLANGPPERKEFFDSWWSEKHDLMKRRFVERLKNRIQKLGLKYLVGTEVRSTTGHFDVLIQNEMANSVRIIDAKNEKSIVVEIKTGFKISLEQLSRYLLDCDVLILVRLRTGHVIKLRAVELEDFLCEETHDLMLKMQRILNGQPISVRGNGCKGCPVECRFADLHSREERLIALDNGAFASDFVYTLRNVYGIVERAIALVLEELQLPEIKMNEQKVDATAEDAQG
jgi:CRISPR/Cas system-associated exonuclease Cas4 (RecB family)